MSVDSTPFFFGTLSIEKSWLSNKLLTLSEVLSTTLIECELSSTLTEGTVSSCLDVPSLSDKGEGSCDNSSTNSKNSFVSIRESLLSSVDGNLSEVSLYLFDRCVLWVESEPALSSVGTKN